MDMLTREQCQEIIDREHNWEELSVTKKAGGTLKCMQTPIVFWKEEYPNALHETVMKYEVGDFASEHVDSEWFDVHPYYMAHAVWITPLNDGYKGGDLYFDGEKIEQKVGVPVKRLRTIPHEITPVTEGTRYSLVSWLFLPREKSKRK